MKNLNTYKIIMETQNKVILCFVKPYNGHVDFITDLEIKNVFQKYGEVKGVQIFEKTPVLIKAFVEFAELSAAQTLLFKNTELVESFATLKVFSSKKKYLVKNVPMKNQNPKKRKTKNRANSEIELDSFRHDLLQQIRPFNGANQTIALEPSWPDQYPSNVGCFYKKMPNNQSSDEGQYQYQQKKPKTTEMNNLQMSMFQTLRQNQLIQSSRRTLMIVRKSFKNIQVQQLLNVFGYFGIVVRVTIDSSRNLAFTKFKKSENMKLAYEALEGIEFFGETFRMSYFNQSAQNNFNESNLSQKEVLKVSKNESRMKVKSFSEWTISTPSNFVIIENAPNSLEPYFFDSFLSITNKPNSVIKITEQETFKTQVVLVGFEHVYQAMEVIADFQNQKVNDKVLKFGFFKGLKVRE